MKIPFWIQSILAALCLFWSPLQSTAAANTEVNFSFFYDSLEPYGEWINTPEYGYCWRPSEVDSDWSPYVDGYWSYTDAGWTWVSYEDWGGICYHYGRWTDLEGEGWCWVPDYEWGPAWVSWRNNQEYIGWAPLPPEARFRREIGFSVWTDTTYDIGPGAYRFCAVEDFGAPVVREVLIPRQRNVVIITNTYNITNICYHSSSVFCGGPDFTFISTRCRRPIPALKIVQNVNINIYFDRTERRRLDCLNAVPRGNTLQVFAPVVAPPKKIEVLKPSRIAKVLPAAKPTGGWGILPDIKEKQDLKATLAKQTQGLTPIKAPALPVKPAQLQPVPVKADVSVPTVTLPVSGKRTAVPIPKSPAAPSQKPQETASAPTPKIPLKTTTAPIPTVPQKEVAGTDPAIPRVLPKETKALPVERTAENAPPSPSKGSTPKPSLRPLPAVTAPTDKIQSPDPRLESLRKQQEDAMRAQSLKQQQDARSESLRRQQEDAMRAQSLKKQQDARSESLRRQQEDAMRAQSLKQQQDARSESLRRQQEDAMRAQSLKKQQDARSESLRRQQEDAMRAQSLKQQQDARSESLRRQQEDAMRAQSLKQQQDARSESLRRQQEDAMRAQSLKQQQDARSESLRRQQEDAMRAQSLRQQQEAARSESLRRQQESAKTLRPVPQMPPRAVPNPVPASPTPSSSSGKKKEKD